MVLQFEQNDKVTDSTLKNLQSLNFDDCKTPQFYSITYFGTNLEINFTQGLPRNFERLNIKQFEVN